MLIALRARRILSEAGQPKYKVARYYACAHTQTVDSLIKLYLVSHISEYLKGNKSYLPLYTSVYVTEALIPALLFALKRFQFMYKVRYKTAASESIPMAQAITATLLGCKFRKLLKPYR